MIKTVDIKKSYIYNEENLWKGGLNVTKKYTFKTINKDNAWMFMKLMNGKGMNIKMETRADGDFSCTILEVEDANYNAYRYIDMIGIAKATGAELIRVDGSKVEFLDS